MIASETVRLEIPNSPRYVSVARKALEGIAMSLTLTEEQVADLKLAVGEACTNAVKYGSSGEPLVLVEFDVTPECLEIRVRNKGASFDHGKRRNTKPNVAGLPVGGLGIYVIEQCVDKLDIKCNDGETIFTMRKKLKH